MIAAREVHTVVALLAVTSQMPSPTVRSGLSLAELTTKVWPAAATGAATAAPPIPATTTARDRDIQGRRRADHADGYLLRQTLHRPERPRSLNVGWWMG